MSPQRLKSVVKKLREGRGWTRAELAKRASVTEADGAVWLHFGRGRYQEKFSAYLQNRPLWQQRGEAVRSVDLRYRGQIILNPDQAAEKANP